MIIIAGAVLVSGSAFSGCKTTEVKRAQKEAYRMQKKSAKADKKVYKAKLKAHRKMQSKETVQMMKKTGKKSKDYNRQFRRKFFLWRWLGF